MEIWLKTSAGRAGHWEKNDLNLLPGGGGARI